MIRPLTWKEKIKCAIDLYRGLYPGEVFQKRGNLNIQTNEKLIRLAQNGNRVALWQLLIRESMDGRDKPSSREMWELVDKVIEDIWHDSSLVLWRAFWQSRNLR